MNNLRSLVLKLLACLVAPFAQAQVQAIPPNILASSNLPMVMLSASKDFTMFWRAYTDFDDIDSDGVVDRTFKPTYKYYGYFDATKCYSYSTTNGRFEPKRLGDTTGGYYCTAGQSEWSGNFLNWATMSRIDVLRKVLYGGKRITDSTTDTTLDLSFVPRNSQAIVKYYNGADLDRLTPYNSANALGQGITLCRRPTQNSGTTPGSAFTPEIRVAIGNVILWNMTEVLTCNWSGENNYTWQAPTIAFLNANYQTPDLSFGGSNVFGGPVNTQHSHVTSVPSLSGENGAFTARVQVCVTALLGAERCKQYGGATGTYKPIGLLHEFGESANSGVVPARAEFGLMLGSYDYNLTGGVLRKALGQINDEVNPSTGVFVAPATGTGGIIDSMNKITLFGYNAASGSYPESCYSTSITDGHCPSWGNPVGELLLESLRYYAGKTLAHSTNGTNDAQMQLPYVSTPGDPLKVNPTIGASTRSSLYGQPICRPLTMLTITSGSSSFDDDGLANFSQLGATDTAAAITDILGTKEGVTGTVRLVGQNGVAADNNDLCTGKTISGLGSVKGICSDGPNFRGTYQGAGVAWYANTHKIRNDLTVTPPDLNANALMVRQYGVSMSGGVATLAIPYNATSNVFLTPASVDRITGSPIPGNLVDFKILSRSADGKSGAALALWQHSSLGEDQDMDQLQALRWVLTGSTLKVYTQAIEANTGSSQPYATGYTVVGTTADGVHLHSAINDYQTTETNLDLTAALYIGTGQGTKGTGCVLDQRSLCVTYNDANTLKYIRGETAKTYTVTGATNALIREPLWYMSKYGGFKYDGKPGSDLYPTSSNTSVWDVKRSDGKPCGGSSGLSCSDGEPDNYFVARNPDLLESSLREIFETIVNASNNAPAVASSQLNAGDMKYVGSFTASDGHGELSGYPITANGDFATTPTWFAHTQLTQTSPLTRQIITNSGQAATPFQWSLITTAQQNILKNGSTATAGQAMLSWLRGDQTANSLLRTRAAGSVMGPIVNSNPVVELPPNGKFFGADASTYATFITTYKNRKSLLWVGAGDGMLHAFDANRDVSAGGSSPIISFVPAPIFSRLPDWTSPTQPTVQAFVDGSPFVGDVKLANWRTYLFSSLGRGAKAMFALDVTDPTALTESNATSIFKWQFTESDDLNVAGNAPSGDLGYIVSEPTSSRFTNQSGQIAPMNNGKFAALFGNGVSSTNGSAALYILFADGPDTSGSWVGRYKKFVVNGGTNNSLSQPVWVDTNGDGKADVIYAGDTNGNLWKFDVSDANPANWKIAYGGLPLYSAQDTGGNALPISNAPEVRPHPLGGLIVNFATGKAVVAADYPKSTSRMDAIFGIWDKPIFSTTANASLPTTLPRGLSNLSRRTFGTVASGDRYVTGNAVDWTTNLGWYLPFPGTTEMSLGNLAIAASQLTAVSIAPTVKANPNDADACNVKPAARLNIVNPVTGLASDLLSTTPVVINGNTVNVQLVSVSVADQKLRLTKDAVGKGGTTSTSGDVTCQTGSADCYRLMGKDSDVNIKSTVGSRRIFWREIPGLKTLN